MPAKLTPKTSSQSELWLTMAEAAKLGGIDKKTIRRAIGQQQIRFKIVDERYLINFDSLIAFIKTKVKLYNKYLEFGIGQYKNKL